MALQSSPPISMEDIKAEFGLTGPVGLTALYRGAGIVPNTGINAGVPTSGNISVLDFLGASSIAVEISNETISSTVISPADATATYQLNNSGLVQGIRNGITSTEGTWLLGGSASEFEVMVTVNSGSVDSGSAIGSWLNMGTTRAWTRARSADGSGTSSANLTVQIRLASTGEVLDSATVILNATVDV